MSDDPMAELRRRLRAQPADGDLPSARDTFAALRDRLRPRYRITPELMIDTLPPEPLPLEVQARALADQIETNILRAERAFE